MARKIRMEYAGAVYHVMARGNQGRAVFADDLDRRLWLDTLSEDRVADTCPRADGQPLSATVRE